ncbi:alpha-(1-_3)-arabinofuranosyltransferase domain-containing protein [Longivirga aurantiaca]|uniref:Alpha-(1->3)-arabinofuranosyltransferase family protein n=1 Tax=Longivirga aurantiaca TaxID=1837743 RepID=A0ABW1T2W3_9ACTN
MAVTEGPAYAGPRHEQRSGRRSARIADAVVLGVLAVVLLTQDPGRTRFDTKLDLVVDPWGFLARAFSAWDSSAGFGQLQNQAYGYLFPMGPFFGVAHSAGLPTWLTQALWAWVLLAVAYLGLRVLATRLGLPWYAAVLGAAAYALAPRMVTVIGPLSAEALPAALLPWTLVPLVRPGATVRRTAFLAALPVLLMGAANATLTLAVLPVTAVWIVTRGAGRWRLLAWWSGFVAAFTAWWIVPLLVQARYATPFLSFIESGRDTTSGLTPAEVLRGDVHWVAGFVDLGVPWWPAGYQYAAVTTYVVLTLLVAAVSVLGLAGSRMPERRANATAALLGLVVLAAGSSLAPGRSVWWMLLDGPLAPFRNVHKFDPMLRLPLALGFAAGIAWVTVQVSQRMRRRARAGDLPPPWPALPGLAAVALLAVVAVPLVSPGIAAGRTWTQIPPWWQQTADWLAGPGGGERALVVPGSGFGRYLWGRTIDEPLQPLSDSPWAIDNDLPLGSIGSARLLDSISMALRTGHAAPGLADTLRRSGIRYVVVRNDIDSDRALAPSRSVVAATLQASEGVELAAGFGDDVVQGSAITTVDFDRDASRPAIEVYRVVGAAPIVSATPLSQVRVMTGGPESLLPAAAADLLRSSDPVVFTGDSPPASAGGGLVLTDGLLRRDRALGRGDDSLSAVLTAEESSRLYRRGTDLVPFAAPELTTASYDGIRALSASTSQAFADAVGSLRVERQPFAALDGALTSWWQSSVVTGPVGQWWQVDLLGPTDLRGMTVTLAQSPFVGGRVTRVQLTTDVGSWTADVDAAGTIGPQRVDALVGASTLRVTALEAEAAVGDFGIREVALPTVEASRPLLLAAAPAGRAADTSVVLTAVSPARNACASVDDEVRCDPTATRSEGDAGVLDRSLTVGSVVTGDLRISGVIRSGPGAAGLFDPVGAGITARASSWLGSDVRVRPSAAVDGDPGTRWVADVGDTAPVLTLDLGQTRQISSLRFVTGTGGQRFSTPLAVTVVVGGRSVEADLRSSPVVTFPPTPASRVTVTVRRSTPVASVDGASGRATQAPVAVDEVVLAGAEDLVYRPDLAAATGALCGLGPTVVIDGSERSTLVTTTLADVLRGAEASVRVCRGNAGVTLSPGTHRVTVRGTALVDPVRVAWGSTSPPAAGRLTVVTAWDETRRTVMVASGPESVLRVAESANAGWVATLDDQVLTPVRLDGWQQGWIVPAGASGVVTLEYRPTSVQQSGLLAGAVLALLGLLLGLVAPGRGSRWSRAASRPMPLAAVVVVQVGVAVLLLGVVGIVAGAAAAVGVGRRWSSVVAGASVLGAAAAAGAGAPTALTSALALGGLLLALGTALRRRGG